MRAVIYSTVLPAIEHIVASARSVGITPVAVLGPRAVRDAEAADRRDALLAEAPDGLDLCFASAKASLEPLTRALPVALRRVLEGDRGDPQTDEGMTYAPAFGEDYAELDPGRSRAELERQVRAWALMFDRTVVGPVATVRPDRFRVLAATLDDPGDPETPRLDARDGPLWLTSVERL